MCLRFLAFGPESYIQALWISVMVQRLVAAGSEGCRRAFSSVSASEYERGTAFGWYHLTVGQNAISVGVLSGELVLLANQQESR